MTTREQHLGTMDQKMQRWGTELESLVARADAQGSDVDAGYRYSIDELKLKYRITADKLDTLRGDSGETWDTLKPDLEAAWRDLETAFAKLTS